MSGIDLKFDYSKVGVRFIYDQFDGGEQNAKPYFELNEAGEPVAGINPKDVQTQSPGLSVEWLPELDIYTFDLPDDKKLTLGLGGTVAVELIPGGKSTIEQTVPVTIPGEVLDEFLGTTTPATNSINTSTGQNITTRAGVSIGIGPYVRFPHVKVGSEVGVSQQRFYGGAQMGLAEQRKPGQFSPNGSTRQSTNGETDLIDKIGLYFEGSAEWDMGQTWDALTGIGLRATYRHTFGGASNMRGLNPDSNTTNPVSYGGPAESQLGLGATFNIEKMIEKWSGDGEAETQSAPDTGTDKVVTAPVTQPMTEEQVQENMEIQLIARKCPVGVTVKVGPALAMGTAETPSVVDVVGVDGEGHHYFLSNEDGAIMAGDKYATFDDVCEAAPAAGEEIPPPVGEGKTAEPEKVEEKTPDAASTEEKKPDAAGDPVKTSVPPLPAPTEEQQPLPAATT
ncbi:MAG: hypothetical protein HQM16_18800 [Deltaproteobacteria bacterium]|nr:hypothetical protein [Deltaproteobacteria bacterium]